MFNRATLPTAITSYDVLKTFAVVFMIIDHIGYYFFPDELWWRVFGRACVPAWFFLIGYARSRDIGPRMWIGGTTLLIVDLVCGKYLLPLNILFSMLAIRMMLNPMMDRLSRAAGQGLWAVAAVAFLAYLPTAMVFEYGTLGLLLAMVGWFARAQNDQAQNDGGAEWVDDVRTRFSAFVIMSFIGLQALSFGFSTVQTFVLGGLALVVFSGLYWFRPATFPRVTAGLGPVAGVVRFMGRWTLEIYVAHLILFSVISMLITPDRFDFMGPYWTSTGFASAALVAP